MRSIEQRLHKKVMIILGVNVYEKKKIAKIKKKPGAERRPLLVRGRYCLKNIQKKN